MKEPELVRPEDALPGRDTPVEVPDAHHVHGRPLTPPWPDGHEMAVVGGGCFWGIERLYWQLPGVWTTAVGYAGGSTPNPTYPEVCTGRTGHAEVVLVVFDPAIVSYEQLLVPFWEQHDPTQRMRQGNDIGTQYRSIVLSADDAQREVAEASRARYQDQLRAAGYGDIATTIEPLGTFYYAEPEHQQYLSKHPGGYCNHGFCQVAY
jgi:peptide-methionine (S)-S-oxide reductase